MKNYNSLIDALSDLRKRGYDEDFETDPFCLYGGDLDIRLNPEAFEVDEIYRFEGHSSPDDSVVLYVISLFTGAKGTLVDAYRVCSAHLNFETAQKLRDGIQ